MILHGHVLIILTFLTYTQQMDPAFLEKYTTYEKECGAEEGVDVAAAGKLFADNKFPDDKKLKCYHKCINMKLGIIDATGEVVDDKLKEVSIQFNDNATEIVDECGQIHGTDLCDTAYRMLACIKAAELD